MTEEAERIWKLSEEYVRSAKTHLWTNSTQITRRPVDQDIDSDFDAIGELLRIRLLFPQIGKTGTDRLWQVRSERWILACLRFQEKRVPNNNRELIGQREASFHQAKAQLEVETLPQMTPIQREIVEEKFLAETQCLVA